MKFSEAVKEVENNRKKVFQSIPINPYDDVLRLSIRQDNYLEIINLHTDKSQSTININRDWEEVKKPVTWQEAFEAWSIEKKDIYCQIDERKFEYSGGNPWCCNCDRATGRIESVSRAEILHGKWFIK